MSKFFEPLVSATEEFFKMPRIVTKADIEPRLSAHVPFDPGFFTKKVGYQRQHSRRRWFSYVKVPRKKKSGVKRKRVLDFSPSSELPWDLNRPFNPREYEPGNKPSRKSVTYVNPLALRKSGGSDMIGDSEENEEWEEEEEEEEIEEEEEQDPRLKNYNSQQIYYLRLTEDMLVSRLHAVHRQLSTFHMDLKYCSMRAPDFKAICCTLLLCHLVSRLDLTECRVNDEMIVHLCDLLDESSSITDLILRDNNLGYRQVKLLLINLRDRDNIIYLDLSGNGLRDDSGLAIARYMESASSLTYLNLSKNNFTEESGKYFGSALSSNHYLRHLDVSWNKILKKTGAKQFMRNIAFNDYIEFLDVSWNKITQESIQHVTYFLSNNTALRHLSLVGTGITSEGLDKLMKGFQENQILETIKLYHNPILDSDFPWFLNGLLTLQNTALLCVDFSGLTMTDHNIPLLEELHNRHIEIIYSLVISAQKLDMKKLARQIELAQKQAEHDDMRDALMDLKHNVREKLANHFLDLDLTLMENTGQMSDYLKETHDGFVSLSHLAHRVLDQDGSLENLVEELKDKQGNARQRRLKFVKTFDPMDFWKLRNVELRVEYQHQIDRLGEDQNNKASDVRFSMPLSMSRNSKAKHSSIHKNQP